MKEIELPVWWSNGHMIFNRYALDWDHPENAYNYIKRTYGVDPADYGIEKPCREPLSYQTHTSGISESHAF